MFSRASLRISLGSDLVNRGLAAFLAWWSPCSSRSQRRVGPRWISTDQVHRCPPKQAVSRSCGPTSPICLCDKRLGDFRPPAQFPTNSRRERHFGPSPPGPVHHFITSKIAVFNTDNALPGSYEMASKAEPASRWIGSRVEPLYKKIIR